jgi:hypothetical protein
MTPWEFREYHNIASLTRRRGEGIGFAGVGAKIFLERAEYTLTETKFRTFQCATNWAFREKSLEYEPIQSPNKIPYPTGTYVEVKLKDREDINKLTPQFVKETLQKQYNAILMGLYNIRTVAINEERVEPWQVAADELEERKDLNFRFGGHHIRGFLIKARRELPDEFQGPFIVVYGKTVKQCWFRQYPDLLMIKTFYGLILADYLINILTTSKSDFELTSMLWKKFHGKMGRVLSEWLNKIGARLRPPTVPTDLDRMSRELERSINDVLRLPEFTDLANTIFQNIMRRTVGIRSERGEFAGTEVEGSQRTTGILDGLSEGGGIDMIGEEEGTGIIEDESGATPIERVRRRVKGGIRIGYDDRPEDPSEGWVGVDPQTQRNAIIINKGHPAWKVAEGLTLQAHAEHVRVYHVLRSVVTALIEESGIENPKEVARKLFSKWYEHYIGG